MKNWFLFNVLFLFGFLTVIAQDIKIQDADTKEPVSFATISFGNGNGTFADGDGIFKFTQKMYTDVDTLFISSLGYKELAIPATAVPKVINLTQTTDQLETVILNAKLEGKFKNRELKPVHHDVYFDCWLPTVESEIAVRFNRVDEQPTQITTLQIPVVVEKSQVSKKGKLRAFSTLFRVLFYDVAADGSPVRKSVYPNHTFIITEETDEIYEVNIEHLNITIPKSGLFASIQVLGYTNEKGTLIDAKKYREIKTRSGFTKISTTYRPLLPFTETLTERDTYVRRIFLNDRAWQIFDLSYNPNSALVRSGHDNYGMGATFKVFYRD
ncbi:MAG: carboxypeptidase-like regulatory domain-containing protein [Nonlabens sp.]|nr:carboxypeptidase-like regulatory domain-containing protein [Nonlabens sp.]